MRTAAHTLLILIILLSWAGNIAARKSNFPHHTEVILIHDTIYVDSARLVPQPRSLEEIISSLPDTDYDPLQASFYNAPRVLRGFKKIQKPSFNIDVTDVADLWEIYDPEKGSDTEVNDSSALLLSPVINIDALVMEPDSVGQTLRYNPFGEPSTPQWLKTQIELNQIRENASYISMINNPATVDYAFWQLPVPPKMPPEDKTFAGYIRGQWIPRPKETIFGGLMETEKINWIHDINGGIQFSQAYISPNWYQGGNNSLSLLIDLLWRVQLNTIFHPNLLFDNSISYKLGITSSPQDEYHKYAISEDLFQWNLKAGVKAFERWFYSVTFQFKTQLLNNYPANSPDRSASFLSPGDFNAGLGMTYAFINKKKNFKFNASISPVSYNLKTCIDPLIDPTQFNIKKGQKYSNEIGSNSELTIDWNIVKNLSYRSRLFLFTNYSYFQGDWENTFSFKFNKFLSTQIYCHLRYDSSSDLSIGKWHNWMMKEILSFGISYTFSTKA